MGKQLSTGEGVGGTGPSLQDKTCRTQSRSIKNWSGTCLINILAVIKPTCGVNEINKFVVIVMNISHYSSFCLVKIKKYITI